jgi:hypothetical protein
MYTCISVHFIGQAIQLYLCERSRALFVNPQQMFQVEGLGEISWNDFVAAIMNRK